MDASPVGGYQLHRMTAPIEPHTDTPNEALLVSFGNGDAEAAMILTRRLTPKVLGYAARLLDDRTEAEDVAQEAMLRLWKVAPDWRQNDAKVTTWLYRVVTNLCTDRLRKRGRTAPLDAAGDPADDALLAEARMTQAQRADALQAALGDLPERQRQAVVLRHLEGLSNPEIAAIMDIGTEAVESLTARAKRALAARLASEREALGYEDD